MIQTTTIRVSKSTQAQIALLADKRHETVDQTVRAALRALRQDAMAVDLSTDLEEDESEWLDADAG
ncbi:hypothetical protein [Nigerium massiliense]|uniref:hypothetical protein n=1 Tax=Nigerium massiliense TaxID=1522317 RepID=UPI0005900C76|nr:hypothetical protein [Nigerium massiliense]